MSSTIIQEAGTPESGHEQSEEQPPLKKARIKLEKDRTDSKGTTANTPPSWAPGRREIQSSESLSTVAPGEEDDDPLAVYARIEAETVNDEGLEALLHSSKRSGYLDLRRYRKPGWPRPLRITRLEASHGKRCVSLCLSMFVSVSASVCLSVCVLFSSSCARARVY